MIEIKQYSAQLKTMPIADGFFEGWPNPPSKEMHRKILENSFSAFVAIDSLNKKIIGFINVISDGILSAYVPLLEVIPAYRNQGMGKQLVETAFLELENLYMVDLSCDDGLVSFYQKLGMHQSNGMIKRNFNKQSGESAYQVGD